jgi:hypothetical protein
MSKTHLRAAIVGGLVVFIWSMFSWMALPWHQKCMNKFTYEDDVASVIRDNAPVPGIYVLPNTFGYKEGENTEHMHKAMKMMEEGPFMFASIQPNGMGKMGMKPFVGSLILQFIGAYFVTWMLMQTKGMSFRAKVGFVTLFGLSVGVLGKLPDWNWWGFSASYVMTAVVDLVIGWFLAGLAIAKVLKK